MSISKHAVYNVAGALVPSVLTLVTIPLYLNLVGVERFGVLMLCWVILGYSGIFDVGLGQATARKLAASRDGGGDASGVFWTSGWLSLLIGLIGGVLMYGGSSLYFRSLAEAGSPLRSELALAVPVLSLMVPTAMLGAALNGALQGRERFLMMNVVSGIIQISSAALPLAIAYLYTTNVAALIAAMLVVRLIVLPFVFEVCRRELALGAPKRPSWLGARELLSFGGWVSLILVANAVIQTLDRLLIGSRIGAAAVPTYAIPYGLVSRIILIPHSLSSALFPRFAYASQQERERLTLGSVEAVTAIVTPAIIGAIAVTEPFLDLWIGRDLAAITAPIAYVLAGGFWIYCIGHMAYSKLQATGRPDLVAKVLLAELLPYAGLLLLGLWAYGVMGAAAAFTARAVIDCLIFLYLAAVPWRSAAKLLLPGALTVITIIVATVVSQPLRYGLFAALFAASIGVSLRSPPEALKPYLAGLAGFIPRWRRSSTKL
jgi:O-antigen/teichoic acid export membrane protein